MILMKKIYFIVLPIIRTHFLTFKMNDANTAFLHYMRKCLFLLNFVCLSHYHSSLALWQAHAFNTKQLQLSKLNFNVSLLYQNIEHFDWFSIVSFFFVRGNLEFIRKVHPLNLSVISLHEYAQNWTVHWNLVPNGRKSPSHSNKDAVSKLMRAAHP